LQVSPVIVWHSNGRRPDRADLIGRLTFLTQYGPRAQAILALAHCPPPAAGAIAGKTVAWYPSSGAQKHGTMTAQELVTKTDGTVTATYLTVAETAPEDAQIPPNQRGEGVEVSLQVLDLLEYFPKTLMVQRAILGTAVPPGGALSPAGTVLFGVNWYAPRRYTAELAVDIEIAGTELLGTAVAHGTIPVTFAPVQDDTIEELRLAGNESGPISWTTTPGPMVNCGKIVISGSGVINGFVLSGTINETLTDAQVHFMLDLRGQIEKWTIPGCNSPNTELTQSWWPGFFILSHAAEQDPAGEGLVISGWSFTAADPTTGVIVGQRTYTERCEDLCTGETTFTLTLTPVRD
ncbi:MAG: hypothetical protein ABIP53_11570, partial [Candidatus Limnocylindrales bacterium]